MELHNLHVQFIVKVKVETLEMSVTSTVWSETQVKFLSDYLILIQLNMFNVIGQSLARHISYSW